MNSSPKKTFIKAIKGKIIIALLLACFALLMAWGVSKVAFKEMLTTVENISTPSERLRMVNLISLKISRLDQQQKKQAYNSPGNYSKLFQESRQLRLVLDSLGLLYGEDSVQLQRIASIKSLLRVRDNQFVNYLKVREGLVNNKSFSAQVKKLSELVNTNAERADSTVLASTQRSSTTTIYSAEKAKGFLKRLFGRKSNVDESKDYKVINEENIVRDTISLSNEDKISKSLEESLRAIEKEQQLKSAQFLSREAQLANANNRLISQMLDILRKVESEVVTQIEQNGIQAKHVVNTGINTITIIMVVFFLLMVMLLYFILTDITKSNRYRSELELARDEAEYHGRAKQRFLSNMSHEIRTPLQSIIGYAELIKYQDKPDHKDIDAIYHSSEHLLQIVNEILDYNRIISGKFTFADKPFDIARLLDEVIAVMQPQAERKSLRLVSDIELHELRFINGDAFRLKQILYNLIGNAIKFTLEGEVVLSVSYKRQFDNLHFNFMVRDTGVGLTEAQTGVIFNEFEQVQGPENEVLNKSGAGLGLTIIKSLVENQGGRIYVKSKPGAGSVFTVYLTFKLSESPGELVPDVVLAPGSRKEFMVWIVDDDELILDLCGIIFEKNQISYRRFNTPYELLDEKWTPDVKYILLDMRMPGMDGIELCRLLRGEVGMEVRIIAITAQVLPDEREYLLNNGFDGLVMKPFREVELLAIFKDEEVAAVLIRNEVPLASAEAQGLVEGVHQESETEDAELMPNLSSIIKMTFGDEEQLRLILSRFVDDSQQDMNELNAAIREQDNNVARLVTHRLAGRIAQLGSAQLAAAFRKMELRVAEEGLEEATLVGEMQQLLKKLSRLLLLITEEYQLGNYSIS
ncbi:two-component system sensor histidine kinase [Pedobacter sp. BAL39]|uniref:ATP-binding protein n=1 Tax=Pedobacter sp. BAL39 TaxID=391596 RepID=UPI0001559CD0|nr:ATP-binding protein [Pedobacter sp. BAL39]EDM37004.1 two-component system sensor histidine kinase [Pedobacter sp. BAL39]